MKRDGVGVCAEKVGFREGARGTLTSRTIMLRELRSLLAVAPAEADRVALASLVVDANITAKRTLAGRRLALQRLSELYGLDSQIPVFEQLRRLWPLSDDEQPMLAVLCSLARDPLLRLTAPPILALRPGEDVDRAALTAHLRAQLGSRLSDATLAEVIRNALSSWKQSGHLKGRSDKVRAKLAAGPVSATYAAELGFMAGARGPQLLRTVWARTLDTTPDGVLDLLRKASRLGLLRLRHAGEVLDIGFAQELPSTGGEFIE